MAGVVRFGVSIDSRLLTQFDGLIEGKGYMNRSEAVRDLIRGALVEHEWSSDEVETVATVTLVYDHHVRALADKLAGHQHAHHEEIVSTLHIHLDAHHCLEVVVLRGLPARIERIATELIGTKGVKHGKFVATTTGDQLL